MHSTSLTGEKGSAGVAPLRTVWIGSKRFDSLWFLASAFSPLIFVFLHATNRFDMFMVWFVWTVVLDTPHYFGTYLRTYMDSEQMKEKRRLFYASFLFLAVGPAIVGSMYWMENAGVESYRLPLVVFTLIFNFWAYWHLVRQHYGLQRLYHAREKAPDGLRTTEGRLLQAGFWINFLLLALRHPEARAFIALEGAWTGYPVQFSMWSWEHFAHAVAISVLIGIGLLFLMIQFRFKTDAGTFRPAALFGFFNVGAYLFVTLLPSTYDMPLLIWTGMITIAHDIQYHAIVWLHQKNRNLRVGEDFDTATWISSRFFRYLAAAVFTGVVLRGAGVAFDVWPLNISIVKSAGIQLFGTVTLQDLLFSFMLGVAMHHYFLDQQIWHPGKDARLRNDLKPLH
jgi:hypothetical protein